MYSVSAQGVVERIIKLMYVISATAQETGSEQQLESDRDVYSLPHALEDLEDREVTVSIGGRTIANLHFADDIDDISAGEEEELANVVECLDGSSTAYGIEISAEKIKLMTNNTGGINTEIKVNKQKLETVTSFKNLGSVITDEGSNSPRYHRQQQH